MSRTLYSRILLLPFLIAGSAFADSGNLKCSATVLDLTTRKQVEFEFREPTAEDQQRVENEWGGSANFIPNSAKVVLAGEKSFTKDSDNRGIALSLIVYPQILDDKEIQVIQVVQFRFKQGRPYGSSLGAPHLLKSHGSLLLKGDMVSFGDGREITESSLSPSYQVECTQLGSET